jgi:hypothetical protein
LAAFLAVLTVAAGPAQAQNFFERLFGITPSRPPPPPETYRAPAPRPPPAEDSSPDEPRRAPAASAPAPARPLTIRAPSEDSVIGREFKQNGSNGSLRIERSARGELRARLVLAGRRAPQSVETCSVALGGQDGMPLVSLGRPEGAARYQIQDPTCPMQLDLLDEAVLVKGSGEACVFQALSCQGDPGGLWGPEPAQLLPRVRDYEQMRASADKIVRENYKVLAQRARPEAVRPIVAEQAAFSSDREMVCQTYAREGTTSFCNAKFTEARALSLASRLGVTTTASTQPSESRRRRQADPYALPSSDDLMQRRPEPE